MPEVPNFVCIGAQRSGSTWLTYNLRKHPQIWMTPVKELHFFSTSLRTPIILHMFENQTTSAKRVQYALVRLRQPRYALWALRYLLMPRFDRCYPWLFTPGPDQMSGETTPDYAYLNITTIQRIRSLLPDLKIIYLLRNPVSRFWSEVGRFLSKSPTHDAASMSDAAIDSLIKQQFDMFYKNSNYLDNLQRWESLYQQEQFFIGFFDQILDEPEALLTAIYRFLGVDSSAACIPSDVRKTHNAHVFRPIPPDTHYWITEQLYAQLTGLHERFENRYTAQWLGEAQHCLHPSTRENAAN